MFGVLVWVWIVLVFMCKRKTLIFKFFAQILKAKYEEEDATGICLPCHLHTVEFYISKLINKEIDKDSRPSLLKISPSSLHTRKSS
jgi:hypothetical protein